MKIRSKEPYWLLKNGLMYSYPALRQHMSCDVLIVGAGLAGALMAFQLAREGYEIVVIDKRDVGAGSTSANTSMVQYELDEPLHKLMETIGKQPAMDVYLECVKAIDQLGEIIRCLRTKCEYEFKQSLFFAPTVHEADELRKEFECRKMAGIDVKWLTKNQISSFYGLNSEGGILSNVGATLDAYQLTHALLQHAQQMHGVRIYDHTELTSIENTLEKSYITVDSLAIIECRYIVYATGYETKELIAKDIGKLISTYACISEPLKKIPPGLISTIFWDTEDPYFYFRATSDNRILIGGDDENFKDPEKRDALLAQKESDLIKKFKQYLPKIDFVPDFTWAGTFGLSKDSMPYIGPHPDFPNSFFVLGFGGNGITFSIIAMQVLSDALKKRHNKFLEYFKFKR